LSASGVLFRILTGIVLLAPLPLGSNRPWAWNAAAVLVGLTLIAWTVLVLADRARAPMSFARLWPVAVPFVATLLWSLVQIWDAVPAAYQHPLWAEAATALNVSGGGVISVDSALTLQAISRLACYGGVFWLAAQLGRDRSRAREALFSVGVGAAVYAVYGLVVHIAGWETILWMPKWAYLGDLTSTLVNRNGYGAYAGLGLVCCLALFIHAFRPSRTVGGRARDLAETILLRASPYLVCALIVGTALLLSHSRGAFLSSALAVLVLLVSLAAAGVIRARAAVPLIGAVLVVGMVALSFSGDATMTRLTERTGGEDDMGRINAYRLTMEAIDDSPLVGNGLGTFPPAFRVYRDISLSEPKVWDYAHNVHLETAMDLGLPGTIVFYLSFASILVVCPRGIARRRRDHVYPATAISALVLLGAHGLVDFSPQTPAVAMTLALLLGVGYAQSWPTHDRSDPADSSETGPA